MGAHPRRQEGRRRREALLKAAVEVAGEQGAGATTHRAVAARAGVPLAATSYYFDSIGELLAEAMRTAVAARVAELRVLAGPPAGVEASPTGRMNDSPAAMASRFAVALTAVDRTASLAQMEAYLHAARTPGLQAAVSEALVCFQGVAEAALRAAGAQRAPEGARAFVALADGFLLHRLADPQPDDERQLASAIRCLFIAYAMNDDERTAWDHRLAAGPAGEDSAS